MVFTNTDATILVAWFTTVVVFLYSGSMYMSRKFNVYYNWIISATRPNDSPLIQWAPHRRTYGFTWFLIAGLKIAANTLWTMNYSVCYNTYFIMFIALALAELVFLAAWAPAFVKWGRPRMASWSITLAMACCIVNVVFMGITLSFAPDYTKSINLGCIQDDTSGIIATVFYGLPLLWYAIALYISLQWMFLGRALQYPKWLRSTEGRKALKEESDDNNKQTL